MYFQVELDIYWQIELEMDDEWIEFSKAEDSKRATDQRRRRLKFRSAEQLNSQKEQRFEKCRIFINFSSAPQSQGQILNLILEFKMQQFLIGVNHGDTKFGAVQKMCKNLFRKFNAGKSLQRE